MLGVCGINWSRGGRGGAWGTTNALDDIQDITGMYLGDPRMAVKDRDNWGKRTMTQGDKVIHYLC